MNRILLLLNVLRIKSLDTISELYMLSIKKTPVYICACIKWIVSVYYPNSVLKQHVFKKDLRKKYSILHQGVVI